MPCEVNRTSSCPENWCDRCISLFTQRNRSETGFIRHIGVISVIYSVIVYIYVTLSLITCSVNLQQPHLARMHRNTCILIKCALLNISLHRQKHGCQEVTP
jgi:hypothetical protein